MRDLQAPEILQEIGIPRDLGKQLSDFSDVDVELWELLTAPPKVNSPWNVLLALLNVFFPGIGTLLCSLWGEPCSKAQAIIGVLQFCMSFFIIGWIWSIVWSYFILKQSCSKEDVIKFYTKAQKLKKDLVGQEAH